MRGNDGLAERVDFVLARQALQGLNAALQVAAHELGIIARIEGQFARQLPGIAVVAGFEGRICLRPQIAWRRLGSLKPRDDGEAREHAQQDRTAGRLHKTDEHERTSRPTISC